MKITAIAIGGPEDGRKLTGHENYRLLYIHPKPKIHLRSLNEPPALETYRSSAYRLEQFQYATSGIEILKFNFWISEDLTNDEAFMKIMEGYSSKIEGKIPDSAGKIATEILRNSMVNIPYSKEYKDQLKKEGVIPKSKPQMTDEEILQYIKNAQKEGWTGDIKDPCPDFIEEQKKMIEEEKYDPWDSKNWGL